MSLGLLLSQEQTCRFNYIFSLNFVPLQISRITFCRYTNLFTVYNQLAVFNISFDCTFESTVHSIILQHVSQVIYRTQVIDTYNLDVTSVLSSTEYETADTTETFNTYFNHFT